MKILVINNFHYKKGGSESVYFNVAKILENHGHEVMYFSFEDSKTIMYGKNSFFVKRPSSKLKAAISYINNKDAARNLDLLLSEWKPDIAHINLVWGGLSSSIFPVLRRHGVHIVHMAHDYRLVCPAYTFRNGDGKICLKCENGQYYNCFLSRCSRRSVVNSFIMTLEMYYRQIYRNPNKFFDGVIYVSRFSKQIHEKMNEQIKSIDNIVLHNFTIHSIEKSAVIHGGYFLYFGRLSVEKGIDTLIRAISQNSKYRLKIVGEGPQGNELENLAKSLGAHNIEFLGFKTGNDLTKLICESSWVVVPSEWYENNPMAIIEAFSFGKPIIGSNIGGIPELVEISSAGVLFTPGDVTSLCGAIKRAASLSPKEYTALCNNAYKSYCNYFSAEKYYNNLMEFYKAIQL